jgi:hypothetical protein
MRYERTDGDLSFFINRPFAVDGHGRFRYGENWQKVIEPCSPIEDNSLCIGRLDNSNLQLHRFSIEEYDRKPIMVIARATGETCELRLQGKSTFILLEPSACNKMFIKQAAKDIFDKESDRHDHVHVASVGHIEEAGWKAYYAPLQLEHLFDHVRLVAQRTIETGEDPDTEDILNLISVFTLIPNLHG